MDDALTRLSVDCTDAAANAFVGLQYFIAWTQEFGCLGKGLSEAERHLEMAVKSGILHIYHHLGTYLIDE